MSQLNNLPDYQQPIEQGGFTSKDWYFFFAGLFNGLASMRESAVTLTGSPNTLTAPSGGFYIVNAGTVTVVEWSRDGTTWFTTGAIAGCFPVSSQDQLRITYAVAPTVTFVPT